MSHDYSSPPSPTQITVPVLRHILSLYDAVLLSFYETKVKDKNKRIVAMETDTWRYDQLPSQVAERQTNDFEGLSLKELERLVEWKITHGKFRPFLLPQIRKNDADKVQAITRQARNTWEAAISEKHPSPKSSIENSIKKALDTVCVLKGVGPATGTLVLSIFAPDRVPFFQDELYAWLCQDGDVGKLKYNVKEYFELVGEMMRFIEQLGGAAKVKLVELEKIGFVVGHWDLIVREQRKKTWDLIKADATTEDPDAQIASKDEADDAGLRRKRKRAAGEDGNGITEKASPASRRKANSKKRGQ